MISIIRLLLDFCDWDDFEDIDRDLGLDEV